MVSQKNAEISAYRLTQKDFFFPLPVCALKRFCRLWFSFFCENHAPLYAAFSWAAVSSSFWPLPLFHILKSRCRLIYLQDGYIILKEHDIVNRTHSKKSPSKFKARRHIYGMAWFS